MSMCCVLPHINVFPQPIVREVYGLKDEACLLMMLFSFFHFSFACFQHPKIAYTHTYEKKKETERKSKKKGETFAAAHKNIQDVQEQ